MFTVSLDQAKSYFFDKFDWDDILEPAEYQALNRVGWIMMKQARRNIRKRKNPSRPGSSPSNWTNILKDKPGILYWMDPDTTTVMIGPVKIAKAGAYKTLSQPTVPAILEFGGKVWNKFETITRKGNRLPGPRTVRVQPRPYMSKALDQKKKKIMKVFEDFIGKSPASMGVVNSKEAKYSKP